MDASRAGLVLRRGRVLESTRLSISKKPRQHSSTVSQNHSGHFQARFKI